MSNPRRLKQRRTNIAFSKIAIVILLVGIHQGGRNKFLFYFFIFVLFFGPYKRSPRVVAFVASSASVAFALL